MNFEKIEMAAAELRNEPWVTSVSMNADPAVREYLTVATPTRVHEMTQVLNRLLAERSGLVLELAAERQRADMLLDQGKIASAAVQAEQQRYEALAQELAAAKAHQGGGELPQDDSPRNTCSCAHIGECDGSCAPYITQSAASVQPFVPAGYENETEFLRQQLKDSRTANKAAQRVIAKLQSEQPDTGRDAALVESVDTLEFCDLITELVAAHGEMCSDKSKASWARLVSHIDAHTMRAVALATHPAPEVASVQPVAVPELLNCPHCAAAPDLVDNGTGSYRVACLVSKGGCGSATRMTFDKGLTAKAEWNRRAAIAQRAPEVASGAQDDPFMYAIMDPDGAAYYEEHCVSPNESDLHLVVNGMNDSPDTGFRVVPLYTRPQPAPALLTDEQIMQVSEDHIGAYGVKPVEFARAVLAAAEKGTAT